VLVVGDMMVGVGDSGGGDWWDCGGGL